MAQAVSTFKRFLARDDDSKSYCGSLKPSGRVLWQPEFGRAEPRMMDSFHASLVLAAYSIGATWAPVHGGEPTVKYGAAGSVRIPDGNAYDMIFFTPEKYGMPPLVDRLDDVKYYRAFLVFSEEDSIEDVKKDILATKPILSEPHQVRMPEWPIEIEYSEEIRAAIDAQNAIRTDSLKALRQVWTNHNHRTHPDRGDASGLRIEITFRGLSAASSLDVLIEDHATGASLLMSFRGQSRRLDTFTAMDGDRKIIIVFYSNGVPFVLHSGDAQSIVGWQIRWLPDGKVARALHLKEHWPPPDLKKSK